MKTWRFLSILLVALTLGMAFAHVLELGPKAGYPPSLYITLQNSLYYWFGTVGAIIDLGAVITTVILTVLVRHRRPALPLTAAAAACQIAALSVWFAFINPVNVAFREATSSLPPPDWMALRAQWEYAHAAGASLLAVAFLLLLASVLAETPGRGTSEVAASRS